MSHLYDTIEPNVISEALLRQCIAEQGPEGEAGRLAKQEGIDFVEVTHLRLDFQSMGIACHMMSVRSIKTGDNTIYTVF